MSEKQQQPIPDNIPIVLTKKDLFNLLFPQFQYKSKKLYRIMEPYFEVLEINDWKRIRMFSLKQSHKIKEVLFPQHNKVEDFS